MALAALLVSVGALMCGTAWALSSPVGSSPDETFHLTSIWCAGGTDNSRCKPAPDAEDGSRAVEVPSLVAGPSCFAFKSEVSGDCQRTITGSMWTTAVNSGTYPGGFYRVMHMFVGDDIGRSVVIMRAANVLLAVLLFAALALNGTAATRRILLYTMSCVLIPLGWFILASVNPSSWALTGIAAYGFALHSLFIVRRRRKLLVNAGVAFVGAALGIAARGDGTVYVGLVSLAMCVLHWRALLARRLRVLVPLACCVVAAVVALSSPQLSNVAGADAETERTAGLVAASLALDFPTLFSGMFGYGFGLGWLDTAVHSTTAFAVVLVVGFLALSGAARGNRSKAVAFLLLGGATLAMPLLTLYRTRLIVGEGVQPRYILPLVPVLMTIILSGRVPWRSLRLARGQAVIIWVMLTVAHGTALYTNTRRYVTGYDDPVVIDHVEWWWSIPLGPVLTCILGAVGFAIFAATIIPVSGRRPVRPDGTRRSSGD